MTEVGLTQESYAMKDTVAKRIIDVDDGDIRHESYSSCTPFQTITSLTKIRTIMDIGNHPSLYTYFSAHYLTQ